MLFPSSGGERLLHQAFLVGLEGFELLSFGSDQGVEAAQARGDAWLFGRLRNEELVFQQLASVDRINRSTEISRDLLLVSVRLEKLKSSPNRPRRVSSHSPAFWNSGKRSRGRVSPSRGKSCCMSPCLWAL